LINTGPWILLTLHQTSVSSCKETSQAEWGFLRHQYLLFWLVTFAFNVNITLPMKNVFSESKNPLATSFWNCLQYWLLAS
jgi:hypothetical protein